MGDNKKRPRAVQAEIFGEGQMVKLKEKAQRVPARLRRKIGKRTMLVYGTSDCPGNGGDDYRQTVCLAFPETPQSVIGFLPGAALTRA